VAVTTLVAYQFRCFDQAVLELDPAGLTVLRGPNGSGKSSLLEAVAWTATMRSFRSASRETMVRIGEEQAVLRAEIDVGGRRMVIEGVLPAAGPVRAQLNRQTVRRRSQLADALRVTVFSPDDLQLVQGSPATRREYLDDMLAANGRREEAALGDVDRALRQRTALLRQCGGRLTPEVTATLDVWDSRLAVAGERVAVARRSLVARLQPEVVKAYEQLAGSQDPLSVGYRQSWEGSLMDALARSRNDDLRRQTTGVGPHRDDVDLTIGGRPARSHASQGEQRSLALALRLASHALASMTPGERPTLLLDDVFSELDAIRSAALLELLPPGQVVLSTAGDAPPAVSPSQVVSVVGGRLSVVSDAR
jgi:DNA replication and repair protein RecF